VLDEVRRRLLVESVALAEPARGVRLPRRHQRARELADRGAELERTSRAVAVPERHLAGLAGCRRDDHAVVRDLLDPPGRRSEDEDVAGLRLEHHLLVELADAPAGRPRLVVFRSLKHIYAQLVDDDRGICILGVSDLSEGVQGDGAGKVGKGKAVGKALAEKAKAAGVSKVVFDRAGYRYHGRVKAVAEGAREAGLEF